MQRMASGSLGGWKWVSRFDKNKARSTCVTVKKWVEFLVSMTYFSCPSSLLDILGRVPDWFSLRSTVGGQRNYAAWLSPLRAALDSGGLGSIESTQYIRNKETKQNQTKTKQKKKKKKTQLNCVFGKRAIVWQLVRLGHLCYYKNSITPQSQFLFWKKIIIK